MKEPIIVSIHAADIMRGYQKEATACPVAIAFRRRFPGATLGGIAPDKAFIDWGDGWGECAFVLTPEAREWVRTFDRCKHSVQPGNLHLCDI